MEATLACAVGRVRALEAKLPGPDKLARLAEGRFDEAAAVTAAAGYARPSPAEDPALSRWLATEKEAARRLGIELLAGTPGEFFCRLPVDRVNLALLGRRELGQPVPAALFGRDGLIEPARLEEAWKGRGVCRLPEALQAVFTRGRAALDEGLAVYETLVNRAVFTLLAQAAGSGGILARLVACRVDRANTRSFFSGAGGLLPGGLVSPEAYRAAAGDAGLPPALGFHYPRLAAVLAEAAPEAVAGAIEAFFRRAERDILAASRLQAFGPEPVIAYLHRRDGVAASLRHLLLTLPA